MSSQTAKIRNAINIGVMTSGGDAQGMNAAIRAVVRRASVLGASVWAIMEGYVGMCAGGDQMRLLKWDDVAGLLPKGGTVIGSSRCSDFRTKEGRCKAALNLIRVGIDRLICIGGDGSLTGANILSNEWPDHLNQLVSEKKITTEDAAKHSHFVVVGMVGSIDNDFSGTDFTIGADSALNKIVQAVDALMTTASSHQRSFVVEVMGRNCGYLAAMAALSVGADYCFIPESPTMDDWGEKMCRAIQRGRKLGRRHSIVIVAEGAKNHEGVHLSSEDVKNKIEKTLGYETRITILGHVQRGGSPSAVDRLIATMMGIEAVNAAIDSMIGDEGNEFIQKQEDPSQVKQISSPKPRPQSCVIAIRGGKLVRNSLVESVKTTQSVASAIDSKDFKKALQLRGSDFERSWGTYLSLSRTSDKSSIGTSNPSSNPASGSSGNATSDQITKSTLADNISPRSSTSSSSLLSFSSSKLSIGSQCLGNVAVMTVGAPSPGMNSAARALTRLAIDAGYHMYAVFESTRGLVEGEFRKLNWIDVDSWCDLGGAILGTNRELPSKHIEECAKNIGSLNLKALFIIGGWEAYSTASDLAKAADKFPQLKIPIIVLPATISNNCPGTDHSIGCDTALNTIVEASDRLKLSAVASRCRVFIMEVHGGRCGYLATAATLAGGAHITYTPEDGISLRRICEDADSLKHRFESCKTMALIVNTEHANKTYTTEMLESILTEESHDAFEVRKLILGHIQQGNSPSPFDRVLAADFSVKAMHTALASIQDNPSGKSLVGAVGSSSTGLIFTPMEELEQNMDFDNRRPKKQVWEHLKTCIADLRRIEPLPQSVTESLGLPCNGKVFRPQPVGHLK